MGFYDFVQGAAQRLNVGCVDHLMLRRHDRFAILPADKGQAIPDLMQDANLNQGLREYRRDRFWKAFESVDDSDQDIVDALGLELVDDFRPELGALGLLDPETEDLFLCFRIHARILPPACAVAAPAFLVGYGRMSWWSTIQW